MLWFPFILSGHVAPFHFNFWALSPVPILLTLKGCLATDIGAEEEEEEEGRQLFAKLSWLGLRRLGEGRERESVVI